MTAREIERVVVVGAGTMGHGIAQVAAASGYSVSIYDIQAEFWQRGLAQVRKSLDKGVSLGKVTPDLRDATLSRLTGTDDLEKVAASADLVIEAAPEDLALKQSLFRRL